MEQKFVLLAAVILAFAATGPQAGAMPQPTAAMRAAEAISAEAPASVWTVQYYRHHPRYYRHRHYHHDYR